MLKLTSINVMRDSLAKFRHNLSSCSCFMIDVWFLFNLLFSIHMPFVYYFRLLILSETQFRQNLVIQIVKNYREIKFPIGRGQHIFSVSEDLKINFYKHHEYLMPFNLLNGTFKKSCTIERSIWIRSKLILK